jgi:hypothetical protein
MELAQFDFELYHVPGPINVVPDALSRMSKTQDQILAHDKTENMAMTKDEALRFLEFLTIPTNYKFTVEEVRYLLSSEPLRSSLKKKVQTRLSSSIKSYHDNTPPAMKSKKTHEPQYTKSHPLENLKRTKTRSKSLSSQPKSGRDFPKRRENSQPRPIMGKMSTNSKPRHFSRANLSENLSERTSENICEKSARPLFFDADGSECESDTETYDSYYDNSEDDEPLTPDEYIRLKDSRKLIPEPVSECNHSQCAIHANSEHSAETDSANAISDNFQTPNISQLSSEDQLINDITDFLMQKPEFKEI